MKLRLRTQKLLNQEDKLHRNEYRLSIDCDRTWVYSYYSMLFEHDRLEDQYVDPHFNVRMPDLGRIYRFNLKNDEEE